MLIMITIGGYKSPATRMPHGELVWLMEIATMSISQMPLTVSNTSRKLVRSQIMHLLPNTNPSQELDGPMPAVSLCA
jgi:hypothetical protein